ncbi:Storkhead-box protein 1 [Camelus dromedarius]|uniref:Storkhead-box protein 1 n=1 Tax=Camelus dromedarius TaxID=9838 RepID=A0A5N4DJ25_CAMDR|nr:Storkhead-box protein 1 [Camelus dromedarius]
MNPIAQSQFIPLAEVLCCAVSDMNAAQIVVTQETLLEHLMKHYPGTAIPSQDILYTTLGSLIKERKIYHTGEGYFIVTPQTYFITSATPKENKTVLSDESPRMPTSITYLVNVESCAEFAKGNAAPISHCHSCRCFPDVCTQGAQEPPAAAEVTSKGQKGFGESKSLVQNRAVSVSEENQVCESAKPLAHRKDREKVKKFGFSLFWRSISRKEKSRTEYSSFSAQFPPEEWPVRDEDNLDNIPRDIEHEIIKRINPILTVDNLTKHTVLMQKYEEQKKYNSQGTSTGMLSVGHKYLSKVGIKKRQGRSIKPRRQGQSHRERHKTRSQRSGPQPGSIRREKYPKLPATQPIPRIKSPNEAVVQTPLDENPLVLGSHLFYKKQISNPFQGLSHRGIPITKGYNIQKTSDLKPSQIAPKRKPFQRERMLRYDVYGGENKAIPEVLRKSYSHFDTLEETKETQHVLPPRGSSSLDQAFSACRLVDKTIHQFQNLGLLDYPIVANHLRQPERQDRDSEESVMKKVFVQEAETVSPENEGLSDDDQVLYQKEVEDDDGACSSLYLDEDDFSENDNLIQMLPGHIQYPFTGGSKWNHLGKQKVTERSLTGYISNVGRSEPHALEGNEHYKPTGLLTNPGEGQKPNLSAESCVFSSGTQSGFNYEEELSVAKCVQASSPADGSVFDYCNTRKAASEAETLQDCLGDTGKKPASWSQSAQNQEMRKQFTQKLELFNTSHMSVLAQEIQNELSHLEGTENHSMAGDSGIDSPRTQSLISSNSVILDGLQRRQNFLQNFKSTKSSQTLTSNSLLQLTPVINV